MIQRFPNGFKTVLKKEKLPVLGNSSIQRNGFKTMLKKEKLPLLGNSSMSNIVFREIIPGTHSICLERC